MSIDLSFVPRYLFSSHAKLPQLVIQKYSRTRSTLTVAEGGIPFGQVSQTAFCFIIEADGVPVGECWLQAQNYERVLRKYPDLDCRRIDLSIGEKARWGQGIGTETIRILTDHAFLEQGADLIYNCGISDYNPRSWRAFQRVGYEIVAEIETSGPGLFIRSHHDSPYVWADTMFGDPPNRIYVFDAATFEVVRILDEGVQTLHPEFTNHGEFVYVSDWQGNAVRVYDAETFEKVAEMDGVTTPTGIFNTSRRAEALGH